MRVFIRDYLIPWLLAIVFWFAIWIFVPQARKNLTPLNLISIFLLLVPFLIVALYLVGKTLENYGYSREDIRRLPEIVEKTHGRLYLSKEIFDIITRALIFWGLFSSAVLMTENPLWGVVNGLAMFTLIFSFFILLISMVIWVMAFPSALYKLFTGRELNRDFLVELIRLNLVFTAILIAVRLIVLHVGDISGPRYLMELIAFGRNDRVVNSLFELAGLNVLFGIVGFYGPRKARKLTALVLTLIVVAQLWVAWGLVFG
ncbi:hypothetical protein [Thermococcus sp. GR6]|uniref:hypothetical protein n=1 Tax=Thermococcus sp. GR6 TaxID=1638256 RepID=UPI00142F8B94|nr:hypothetical protein [Thermococcus sp. GR6]NJE42944.1 hypothetical protein [Thermococcus sp. GR6]